MRTWKPPRFVPVWVHLMCADCWNLREPEHLKPLEYGNGHCCFCGERRALGIHVRENPALVLCGGQHEAPGACWHAPADPDATETICCACGELIWFTGQLWRKHRVQAPPATGGRRRGFYFEGGKLA